MNRFNPGDLVSYQGEKHKVVAAKKDFSTGRISYRLSNNALVAESEIEEWNTLLEPLVNTGPVNEPLEDEEPYQEITRTFGKLEDEEQEEEPIRPTRRGK